MKKGLYRLRHKRILGNEKTNVNDVVVKESPLTLILNDEVLLTLVCYPEEIRHLAIGFLFTEELISGIDDIEEIVEDCERSIVWVTTKKKVETVGEITKRRTITSGCGRGVTFQWGDRVEALRRMDSELRVSPNQIRDLIKKFNGLSEIYRKTGGVHSGALCDEKNVLIFSEDIGRHNVMDKILGRCLLDRVQTFDRILITSGRLSSEIVIKAAIGNIPILISRTSPTDLGVKIAKKINMTLIGFARGQRMNIYSGDQRIEQ